MAVSTISENNLSSASIASLDPKVREAWTQSLSEDEAEALWYAWEFWARPKQCFPEGDWAVWLIKTGRGWGKTRTAAEWVRYQAIDKGYIGKRIALVGRTAADVRDVMIEGESGLLHIGHPKTRPKYEPSKRRLTWPSGAIATTYSADKPDQLRGPQHHVAWADELASWRYAETWDQLLFGLRLGDNPQVVASTTPRPTELIRGLVAEDTTHVTNGHTLENRANLSPMAVQRLLNKYEGTRLGKQELGGEIIDDNPYALWSLDVIDDHRVAEAPELVMIGVAIDPPASSREGTDECGIVAGGVDKRGHGYVLRVEELQAKPSMWASLGVRMYYELKADRVIAEINQGGEMVEHTIRTVDDRVPYKGRRVHRGKRLRAEPVSALYEQGKVHHVGVLSELEDEMCDWVPGDPSPNLMDALTLLFTDLILEGGRRFRPV